MDNSTNVAKYAVKFSHQYKDMFFITFGILMYAFGYTAFILPEHVVMGGVAGISALLFYAFKLPPGIAIWVLNLTMLVIAYRALSKQFVIRTVIGVTILSSLVGVLQPLFEQYPVITPHRRCAWWSGLGNSVLSQWLYRRYRHYRGAPQQVHADELRTRHADMRHLHHLFLLFPFPQSRDYRLWRGLYAYSQFRMRLCCQWNKADCAVHHYLQKV